MTDSTAPAAPVHDIGAFGHPKGLMTLFFTELWERFSYYGMRAFLILYMTDVASGGLGLGTEISGAVYGLYTFGVYALALLGGWIADRIIGQRQAVLVGGIIIAQIEMIVGFFFSPILTTFAFFVVFLIIVTVKPSGLLGFQERRS